MVDKVADEIDEALPKGGNVCVCNISFFFNVSSFVWSFVSCWPVLYFFVATESRYLPMFGCVIGCIFGIAWLAVGFFFLPFFYAYRSVW